MHIRIPDLSSSVADSGGARQPLGFPVTGQDLLGPLLLFLVVLLSLGSINLQQQKNKPTEGCCPGLWLAVSNRDGQKLKTKTSN